MDNFITILKTVFLGIVEGITEWLPISSTGHMILVDELLHMNMRKEFMDIFFVIIQLGAIFAVIILFWSKIWPFHTKKTAVKPYFEGEKIGSIGRVCNSYIYMDKINKVVSEEIFFDAYNTLLENNEKNKTELKEIDKKIYQLENKNINVEDKYKKSIEEFLKLKKPSIQLISTLIDKIVIDDEKKIEIVYKIKPLF